MLETTDDYLKQPLPEKNYDAFKKDADLFFDEIEKFVNIAQQHAVMLSAQGYADLYSGFCAWRVEK